jgi:RNAse (barnase) inhibitor barstar
MTTNQHLNTYLQTARAPWSSLVVVPTGSTAPGVVRAPAGFALRLVNGRKCGTPVDLFAEFARALEFPDYFGHNWDALEECLADLEWLPAKGYVILVTDAQAVIPDDDEEYETLLEVLSDAGEAWSKGQAGNGRVTAFHVVFAVSEKDKVKRKHWGIEEILVGGDPPSHRKDRSSRRKHKLKRRRAS